MNVKKNDTVVVLSGKDKGKRGKVLSVDPKTRKVVVEKINMASRHQKPRKPVSYTHLDVYKRQPLHRGAEEDRGEGWLHRRPAGI